MKISLASGLSIIPEGVVQQKKELFELSETKKTLMRSENDLKLANEEIKQLKDQITEKNIEIQRAKTLDSIVNSDQRAQVSKLPQSSFILDTSSNIGALYGKDASKVSEKYEKRVEEE